VFQNDFHPGKNVWMIFAPGQYAFICHLRVLRLWDEMEMQPQVFSLCMCVSGIWQCVRCDILT
jgi:hypothetical protein